MLSFSKKKVSINFHILNKLFKFNFARKLNNQTNEGKNIFKKFALETNENELDNGNHFKKRLKKENLGMDIFDDKKLTKKVSDMISKGMSVKETLKELYEKDQEIPTIDGKFMSDSNSSIPNLDLENEFKMIRENLNKRKEQIKKTEIDASPYEESEFSQEELEKFKRGIKKQNRMNTKNTENLNKFAIKDVDSEENENVADNFKDTNYTYEDATLAADKMLKNDFENLFKPGKGKNTNTNKTKNSTNVRDLRKIKNSTNPEYSQIGEFQSNELELIKSIPDINISDKRSRTVENEDNIRDLIKRDLHPLDAEIEKRELIVNDAIKLSKINTLNIVDIRKNKNEIFKKRALSLAKLWGMDARETKQWYYRLRREEKLIIKAILMRKRLEQKRKLKKLAKQWKIENEENIDVNYLQSIGEDEVNNKKEVDEEFKIPEHYKNFDEFSFFGEDLEFLRHYKRTCRNLIDSLNEFFVSNKQGIKNSICKNSDIVVSEVKMNKACTVVYVWWDLPIVTSPLLKLREEEQNLVFKTVEVNLIKAMPYIKGLITRKLGFKYSPEIRFIKDTIEEELQTFENEVLQLKNQNEEMKIAEEKRKEENLLRSLDTTEFIDKLKIEIKKISNSKERDELNKLLIDEKSNSISQKFKVMSIQNPNAYNYLMKIIKESVGYNSEKRTEIDKSLETFSEKLTKDKKKRAAMKEKILKKMNIKESDLKKSTNINVNKSVETFLFKYDRKIPGYNTLNPSVKELEEKKKKSEFLDDLLNTRLNRALDKEVRASEKKVRKPIMTKREKSVEFWKNLENYK